MAILENRRTQPARIESIREVRLDVDTALRVPLEDFYESILGLPAWPRSRRIPGGVGFGDARRSVFFVFRHDRALAGYRSRLTIVVESLDVVARRLDSAEVPYQRRRGFFACDDCILVLDPSGNPVQIRHMHFI